MKRRNLLAGASAFVIVVAASGPLLKRRFFRKRYSPTPYDDVLNKLDDREWAAQFGETALKALPDFNPERVVAQLRGQLGQKSLQMVAQYEAEAGQLVEAEGWLVPQSVVLIAALAKSVTP
ncbi:MAG: hypothetical protein JO256_03985 [Alphaproteobacteria bacterium]|nr:hypothetical protein [Alphaproteobacteria bacterium]